MKKTYIEFVTELLKKQEIGKPIYLYEISKLVAKAYNMSPKKATGAVSVAIKRIMDGNIIPELRFYQKGIYYLAVTTAFGETNIDTEQLIEDKYLKNNNGYETGLTLLQKLGLTTQIPKNRILVTNKVKECARFDKKLDVIIRPPKTIIDANNKQYLKILDILEILDNAPIDVKNPYDIIGNYIEKLGLEYVNLLALADNYYNKDTILKLAHVAGGHLWNYMKI